MKLLTTNRLNELAKGQPHGTRSRYVTSKCRCSECRRANREYVQKRERESREAASSTPASPDGYCVGVEGNPCPTRVKLYKISAGGVCEGCRRKLIGNGLVSPEAVRAHLLFLRSKGVGSRAVADAASVSRTILAKVLRGDRDHIRRQSEKRILAVTIDAISDHSFVPAKETWKLVHRLMKEFAFTRGDLARELGFKNPALQIGKRRVLAATELKVKKLYRKLVGEIEAIESGIQDSSKTRLNTLRRLLPETSEDIRVSYPDIWGGDAGQQMLLRDLKKLGAKRENNLWSLE